MLVGLPHEPVLSEGNENGWPVPPPLTLIHSTYSQIVEIGRYLNLPALQSLPPLRSSITSPKASPLASPFLNKEDKRATDETKSLSLGSSGGRPSRRRMKSDAVITTDPIENEDKKVDKVTGYISNEARGSHIHPALRNQTSPKSQSGKCEFDPLPSSGQTFEQLKTQRKWITASTAYQPPNAPNFWVPDIDDYQKWRAGGGAVRA